MAVVHMAAADIRAVDIRAAGPGSMAVVVVRWADTAVMQADAADTGEAATLTRGPSSFRMPIRHLDTDTGPRATEIATVPAIRVTANPRLRVTAVWTTHNRLLLRT